VRETLLYQTFLFKPMEDDDEQKNLSKIYGSDVTAREIIPVSKKRPRDNDTTTTTVSTTTTPMTNSVTNTSSSNATTTLTSSGIIGSSGSSSCSMVIFSSQLGRMLSSTERLAPVYVGVRQIRPSGNSNSNRSTTATTATVWKKAIPIHAPPVYKVLTADGQQRRMTAQEKKQAKMQQKLLAKQQKHDPIQLVNNHAAVYTESNTSCVAQLDSPNAAAQTADRYVQLVVDPMRLEEELADVCADDRDGIPPVMLSPPLARLAAIQMLAMEQQQQQQQPFHVVVDDLLAAKWATALQQSMLLAVGIRQKEQLRTMPYHVVPEVWTRLRPKLGPSKADSNDDDNNNNNNHTMAAADHTRVTAGPEQDEVRGTPPIAPDDWSWCNLRPRTNDAIGGNDANDDTAAIIQLLHTHTNLHISCGAKFGCHYLLYDGPRHERHAFAGLRILQRNRNTTLAPYPFPIHPTAYDVAGYVRCLNTAGKLALLATVVDDSETSDDDQSSPTGGTLRPRRVLLIDLALEKIAATTSRRPKKSMEQRLKNLAKASS
jgi:hypothetical protein